MDFALTDEQLAIQEMARRFAEDELAQLGRERTPRGFVEERGHVLGLIFPAEDAHAQLV